MNIQVGEYLRTPRGEIIQIESIFETPEEQIRFSNNVAVAKCNIFDLKEILVSKDTFETSEHSFNIIDLIKIGDYVNGKLIKEVGIIRIGLYKGQKAVFTQISDGTYFRNEDIETIITKEQFDALNFKVTKE